MKKRVNITVESVTDAEKIVKHSTGMLYPKGNHAYLLYEEDKEELGDTRTTIRLSEHEIRIVRTGDIESEQTFIKGKTSRGHYSTPQGRLELQIRTKQMEIELPADDKALRAEWSYELELAGEAAGNYRLKLEAK